MARRVTERQLNLTIALLATRSWLTRDQIRAKIQGYDGSDGAFERMFERDKKELRELGVPIEHREGEGVFGDEYGYRIRRDDFELPPIALTADEATVVALAAQGWTQPQWQERSQTALAKLEAAGAGPDEQHLRQLRTSVATQALPVDPHLPVWWQAIRDRQECRFQYRGQSRRVHPWAVAQRRGAWYLLAFDLERDDERIFRLSRVETAPRTHGPTAAFTIPALTPGWLHERFIREGERTALMGIRRGVAWAWSRQAEKVDDHTATIPADFDVFRLRYSSVDSLAGAVAELADNAVVISPHELADAVVERLRASAERPTDGD